MKLFFYVEEEPILPFLLNAKAKRPAEYDLSADYAEGQTALQ